MWGRIRGYQSSQGGRGEPVGTVLERNVRHLDDDAFLAHLRALRAEQYCRGYGCRRAETREGLINPEVEENDLPSEHWDGTLFVSVYDEGTSGREATGTARLLVAKHEGAFDEAFTLRRNKEAAKLFFRAHGGQRRQQIGLVESLFVRRNWSRTYLPNSTASFDLIQAVLNKGRQMKVRKVLFQTDNKKLTQLYKLACGPVMRKVPGGHALYSVDLVDITAHLAGIRASC